MLSVAKHLSRPAERPFAALRVTWCRGRNVLTGRRNVNRKKRASKIQNPKSKILSSLATKFARKSVGFDTLSQRTLAERAEASMHTRRLNLRTISPTNNHPHQLISRLYNARTNPNANPTNSAGHAARHILLLLVRLSKT